MRQGVGIAGLARAAVAAGVMAMISAMAISALAQQTAERQALLIPGKQTLQQRVITRPGAILVREPNAAAGEAQLPFSVFYVYGRRPESGASEWLEVGRSSRGQPDGWIKADQAIEWYQNLTLAFTNPAQRDRVMFFRGRDDVFGLLSTPGGAQRARDMRTAALASQTDGPVIAMEPDAFIDIQRRFYLLPILQAERVTLQTGASSTLLEVASIPLTQDPTPPPRAPQQDQAAALRNFTVGVAFVVDTTLSMDPYIERVRLSIRRVIERIRGNADIGTRFRFALIGYRNSTRAVPQLQYVSRIFANFEDFRDPQRFMSLIQQMEATTVDSGNFDEDAMAGVRTAVEDLKWDDFGGRYVVLVTDAGARRAADPLSTTRLGPAEIRRLALTRGIATYVLHLLTPAGARANDHATARAQYEELSNWQGVGPLYFPVPDGSLSDFGAQVDELTDNLVRQVTDGAGAGVQRQAQPTPPRQPAQQPAPAPRRITEQTLLVGNAMRLAYLGRIQQSAAPSVFRAWTTDRDFANPDVTSFDVRLLVTRNQLSDLAEVLTLILEQGNQSRLRPADFFNQLRSAAANMTRNPARLRARDAQNLGELLGEFLSGLPYRSEILELDQDQWLAMGAARQREVLDSIEAKLRLYGEFAQRADLWTSFDNDRVPGDAVFPMPLEALP